MTRLKELKRAAAEGEPTSMERAALKKIKDLKKELARTTAERDLLKALLYGAGLSEATLNEVLKDAHSRPSS